MKPFNIISLILAFAGIVMFSAVLVHALRALKRGVDSSLFLSRAHAWRRVVSASLVLFSLLWLVVGMTFLKKLVFSVEHPILALVFVAVLALAILIVLLLAWLDFRQASHAFRHNFSRSRGERIKEVVQDAIDEYHQKHPPPPGRPPSPSNN